MPDKRKSERLADDLLWGVTGDNGIAHFIGKTPRETYYMIERNVIPVRRLGHKTIVASKAKLRAFLTQREGDDAEI
jgi:hypothetical protein